MSEKVSENQGYIEGNTVAQMILDFNKEFKDTYGPDVMNSYLCAVGPLHSMIGLAIKNGHLRVAEDFPQKVFDSLDNLMEELDKVMVSFDGTVETYEKAVGDMARSGYFSSAESAARNTAWGIGWAFQAVKTKVREVVSKWKS